MFCSKCGSQMSDRAQFCPNCGNATQTPAYQISAPVAFSSPAPSFVQPQEDIIDLSGAKNLDAPQEKRHKGTVIAAFVLAIGWVAHFFLSKLMVEGTDLAVGANRDWIFVAMAMVCVPVTLLGVIFVLLAKKSAGPLPKLPKKQSLVYYLLTIVVSSTSLATAFGNVITTMGSATETVTMIMFIVFLLFFVIIVVATAFSAGKNGMFSLLLAYFISFVPGMLLGYLLAKLIAILFVVIGFVILGAILFFGNGGYVVYHRN